MALTEQHARLSIAGHTNVVHLFIPNRLLDGGDRRSAQVVLGDVEARQARPGNRSAERQDALVADLRPVEVELSELRAAKDPREFEDRLVVDSGVVQVKDLCLPADSIYRTVELPFGKL